MENGKEQAETRAEPTIEIVEIEVENVDKEPVKANGKMAEKYLCTKCEFVTSVPRFLREHKIAHEGQYQCQRGCKVRFLEWKQLDEHIKNHHTNSNQSAKEEIFKCGECDETFDAKFQCRQHIKSNDQNFPKLPSSNKPPEKANNQAWMDY